MLKLTLIARLRNSCCLTKRLAVKCILKERESMFCYKCITQDLTKLSNQLDSEREKAAKDLERRMKQRREQREKLLSQLVSLLYQPEC